jgi:H+/Cl- antiporter ClcA
VSDGGGTDGTDGGARRGDGGGGTRRAGRDGAPSDPRAALQPNISHTLAGLPARFWVALVATGVAAGLGAMAMMALLRAVQHAAFGARLGGYSAAVAAHGDVRRVVVLTVGGAIAGGGWWVLRRRAGGTGGEPTSAVWHKTPDLSLVRTVVSGSLSEVVVGMGASLGREAAPQHIGAASGSWLGRRMGLTTEQCVILVACGAGAGVGAVYNVPLAGALFAAELYLGSFSLVAVVPALVTSAVATVVAWTTLPPHFVYHLARTPFPSASILVFALVAGPVLGLVAAGYVRLIAWASDHQPKSWLLLVEPVVAFAALGLAATEYPLLLGNGRDLAQYALVGGGVLATVAVLAALKPVVSAMCLRSGASGGLFTPTFAFGAVLGLLMGRLWSMAWPVGSPGIAALVGAGAMVGAAMEAPVAGLAFTIELAGTANASIAVLALAVAGATIVARRIEPLSIYSARLTKPKAPPIAGTPEHPPQ